MTSKTVLMISTAGALTALAALPASALAQANGTVNVTGTVAETCSAIGSVTGTIALGELTGPDGKLNPSFAAPDVGNVAFQMICSTGAPKVTVSATRLSNQTTPVAPATFARQIDYTVNVAVTQAAGTPPAITYTTAVTPPPATAVSLTGPLANQTGNVVVHIGTLAVANNNNLLAGAYQGVITLSITPS
jgi:hypothetical protein